MIEDNKQRKNRFSAPPQRTSEATAEKNIFSDGKEYKVAVYMRAVYIDEQQIASYELQKKYYTDLIDRQSNWRLVDIYCDPRASGTSLTNREQFKKMIADCEKGERDINLIITKSISRFSRNIADLMAAIEKLSRLTPPVGVYFELEKLYSLDEEHWPIITKINSIAQDGRS